MPTIFWLNVQIFAAPVRKSAKNIPVWNIVKNVPKLAGIARNCASKWSMHNYVNSVRNSITDYPETGLSLCL